MAKGWKAGLVVQTWKASTQGSEIGLKAWAICETLLRYKVKGKMLGIRTVVEDVRGSRSDPLNNNKKIPMCSQVVSKDAVGIQAHPL